MKIAIIGAGNMGGAIASGLLAGGINVAAANPSQAPLEKLKAQGAIVTRNNSEACQDADIVIVAVKPWIVEQVLKEIKPALDYNRQIIVVVAAGVTGAQLTEWLHKDGGTEAQIILAMPNTAVSVFRSMTFLIPVYADGEFVAQVSSVFDRLGKTMIIDEAHLPAATALASCGIAYIMRYVRAAMEGGVELGFKAGAAQEMICQTILGAAELLSQNGAHPETEIDKVTTPGGLTIRGLNAMEKAGFTSAVIEGLKASVNK